MLLLDEILIGKPLPPHELFRTAVQICLMYAMGITILLEDGLVSLLLASGCQEQEHVVLSPHWWKEAYEKLHFSRFL